VTLTRGLVPCCRQVAAGALCRGGRVCGGGFAGNVEAEASRRDGQLRHHTSQHGISRTGSSRVTQTWLPKGQRIGSQRSVSVNHAFLVRQRSRDTVRLRALAGNASDFCPREYVSKKCVHKENVIIIIIIIITIMRVFMICTAHQVSFG